MLIHSTVRSISLTPVTHLPFPIYSGLCPLSVSVWSFVVCLTCCRRPSLSHLHSVSRIPRRGVVSPLDSVSGLGARDGTPVHLFLEISFLFVLDVVIRSLLINFTPLFCSALESSILFPVASLTLAAVAPQDSIPEYSAVAVGNFGAI